MMKRLGISFSMLVFIVVLLSNLLNMHHHQPIDYIWAIAVAGLLGGFIYLLSYLLLWYFLKNNVK